MQPSGLSHLYEGWAGHQALLTAALRDLTLEQLALRTAPHQWTVWQLAGHIAGTRAFWFHDVGFDARDYAGEDCSVRPSCGECTSIMRSGASLARIMSWSEISLQY